MADQSKAIRRHNLTIENREKINASGIAAVDFYSNELITAQTDIGQLNIKGANLHIENLSKETGDLSITGTVIAISYSEQHATLSFFGRLFK